MLRVIMLFIAVYVSVGDGLGHLDASRCTLLAGAGQGAGRFGVLLLLG
ncbi:hypothetical protein ACIO3R_19790 [Streptomyces sp. NPDC087428]